MTTHITAIASGKGGTGKTLIATSLAHSLAHIGERVLLCDADLGLSNTGVHLGLGETGDLAGLLAGRKTLKDAVVRVTSGPRIGFDLLAAPAGSGALANAAEARVETLIAALERAGQYDRVIVDLGAGIDETVMRLAGRADDVALVVTPDPASLTDAYAFAKLLLRRTSRVPQILVNMALNATEGRRISEALMASARAFLKGTPEYLGFIPYDTRVCEAVRRQSPLLTLFPQTPAATALEQIARKLHGNANTPVAIAGLR